MTRRRFFGLLLPAVVLVATACGQSGALGVAPVPGGPTPAPGPTAPPGTTATYYVGPAGSDTNDCSVTRRCREISRALTLVRAGDTIDVADGSYRGFDVRNLNGTIGRPITIIARGRNAVITATTDRPDNRDNVFITMSAYIIVDGIRTFSAPRAGLRVDQSPSVTIRNSVFGNNTRWGLFTDFSDDLLIEGNEAYGSMMEHGIYVSNSGDRPVVRGNTVHDNAASGIQLNADVTQGGDGLITGALIENNIIYNNGRSGGAALNLDGVQSSMVRNNIFYNNHASGIAAFRIDGAQGPRGLNIYHNTIDMPADGRYALRLTDTTGRNTIRNNIFYNQNAARGGISFNTPADVANADSDYNVFFGGAAAVTPDDGTTRYTLAEWQARGFDLNSLTGTLAALFMSPGVDYHLRPGSPAIDRGQRLTEVTIDFEGNIRPRGTTSDIGADEF
jgi:parallel beta-helix repeat protein